MPYWFTPDIPASRSPHQEAGVLWLPQPDRLWAVVTAQLETQPASLDEWSNDDITGVAVTSVEALLDRDVTVPVAFEPDVPPAHQLPPGTPTTALINGTTTSARTWLLPGPTRLTLIALPSTRVTITALHPADHNTSLTTWPANT
ncbi:hypothetical protein [Cellulomonas uda]|uniref:Uncharacterized protein n=1 Tax=Cellulomonas uda TaxID=1714 RepID=A0A4Y3KFJ5_CELUD|nr:hypothetical protein [Cellulomonas uda]NII66945.1 hypothetical protein [Cellulomonas uda]GEA82742.1 hypothetical protein CUD01_31860 [Cellulomonas uda]